MQLKVSEIAERIKGRLDGDGAAVVRGAAGLTEAGAGDITYLRDARDSKSVALYQTSTAAAVIIPRGFPANGKTVIEVDNPIAGFSEVLALMARDTVVRHEGVHKTAVIDPSARIGRNVSIGPNCVVEKDAAVEDGACLLAQVYVGARSRVGENSYLYPQVVLREDVSVGRNCVIHPGVVLGADGYGFFFSGGRHNKIPQVGTVIVEDDVEIGANTCVDRATTGATVIGKGTKIDNLVQVAHNVQVGEHSLLVAQSGIAGSTRLGVGVVLAGHAGVGDHLVIGDGTRIGAKSGVLKSFGPNQEIWGTPAQPLHDELKLHALFRRLPEMFKDLKKLKEKVSKHG